MPSLISGDDRAQLSLAFDRGSVDVTGRSDVTQTLRLDGAFLLADRWQFGASVPFVRRAIERPGASEAATALGDLRASLSWEALPQWERSAWKPRGFVFVHVTAPTGTSPYQGREVDAVGRGFLSFSAGVALLKRWSSVDLYLVPEAHHGLARTFDTITVRPGVGASVALGLGISPLSRWRVGVRAQPVYESPLKFESAAGATLAASQLTWNLGAETSFLFADGWTLAAAYNDQTLVGPRNIPLSRSFTVTVQHRWER